MADGISGEMIEIMKRMENIFKGMAAYNTQAKEKKEEIDITIKLEEQLQSAVTSSATVKKLSEVLRKGVGGAATSHIKENLAKAARYKKEAKKLESQIAKIKASPRLTPIQKIHQQFTLDMKRMKYRYAMQDSLKRVRTLLSGRVEYLRQGQERLELLR